MLVLYKNSYFNLQIQIKSQTTKYLFMDRVCSCEMTQTMHVQNEYLLYENGHCVTDISIIIAKLPVDQFSTVFHLRMQSHVVDGFLFVLWGFLKIIFLH